MIEHIEQGTLPAHVKACIALTSWKQRIDTVGLTIFTIRTACGSDYHIVLTLSEDEFPQKEQELPLDLLLLNHAGVVEILWVKKNWLSFKKVLFTMQRYRTLPVISADDGCIYIDNFADKLYYLWLANHKRCIIANKFWGYDKYPGGGGGHGTLYPPYCFGDVGLRTLQSYGAEMLHNPNDDRFMAVLSGMMNLKWKYTKDYDCELCPFINITGDGLSNSNAYIKGDNWRFPKFVHDVLKKTIHKPFKNR